MPHYMSSAQETDSSMPGSQAPLHRHPQHRTYPWSPGGWNTDQQGDSGKTGDMGTNFLRSQRSQGRLLTVFGDSSCQATLKTVSKVKYANGQIWNRTKQFLKNGDVRVSSVDKVPAVRAWGLECRSPTRTHTHTHTYTHTYTHTHKYTHILIKTIK